VAKAHISKKTRLTSFLDSLTDKEFVPGSLYFELRDVYHSNTHRNFLDFLTKRRPQLEMVFGWGSNAELIRDMSSVYLSLVPKHKVPSSGTGTIKEKTETGDVNAAWSDVALGLTPRRTQKDDTDDDKSDCEGISKNKKKNVRLLRKIGKQNVLADALGRGLYDWELEGDYDDYDLTDSDDGGLGPEKTRQILRMMDMMDR
jgi:hypothetical protein